MGLFGESELRRFSSDSRYRYVKELFLAAMFAWVNKFYSGELAAGVEGSARPDAHPDFRLAWDKLFVWAFGIRLELQRVTWQSVNRRAVTGVEGEQTGGVFETLRDALSADELHHLLVEAPAAPQGRDEDLARMLREITGGAE